MARRRWRSYRSRMKTTPKRLLILMAILASPVASSPASASRSSAATITASFADSCRDFATRSSKEISHVEIHYADGRVVKDESIGTPDFSIDGGFGEEIESVIVKSGTTSEQFDCAATNSAPLARLEIGTPENGCGGFFSGGLLCEQSLPRSGWTSSTDVPDTGGSDSGVLTWGCGAVTNPSFCSFTFSFRGTGSIDPDGDITSWSLDFGDGTSASGSWSAAPPVDVAHEYSSDACRNALCVITLTVTDSAGQSGSDAMRMVFVDQTPD